MKVKDCIQACAALVNHRPHTRHEGVLKRVAIHRLSFAQSSTPFYIADDDLGAIGIAARFANTDKYAPGYYTKGTIPYTFDIRPNGLIEQLLPVSAVASHALRWNVPALGIACIGDHRIKEPPQKQWLAAVDFCGLWRQYGLSSYGHDELPLAMKDVTKKCPGRGWNMFAFRRACRSRMRRDKLTKEQARSKLVALGVVF